MFYVEHKVEGIKVILNHKLLQFGFTSLGDDSKASKFSILMCKLE